MEITDARSAKPSKTSRSLQKYLRLYRKCELARFGFLVRRSWQFQLLGFLANSGHILKKLNFTSRPVAILCRCVRRYSGQRGPFAAVAAARIWVQVWTQMRATFGAGAGEGAAVAAARIWVHVWTQMRVRVWVREWVQTRARAMVRPWSRLRTQVRATLGEVAFCAGAGKAGCGNSIEGPPPFRHASLSGFRREHLPTGAKLHFCSRHCVVGALYWAQRAACWQRLVGRRRVFATFLQVKVGLRFRAGRGRGLRRTRRMR